MAATQESDVHLLDIETHSDDDEETTQLQTEIPKDVEDGRAKKKRRLTSGIWKEFRLLPSKKGEALLCECINCGNKYCAESKWGTGNLHRHAKSCKKKTTADIGEFIVTSQKGVLSTQNSNFNQEKFKEMVVHAIVRHDLPFSFVEYEGIRSIFNYLEPQTTNFTRNTAKSHMKKIYDKEMIRLRGELVACPSRICLTSDAWTSIATNGYLSLTAHYVDSNWILRKKILNFSYFPPPHSGIAIAEKITDLITGWGIEKKLFSITLDNASSNDSCVGILKTNLTSKNLLVLDGTLFHVRCCAHILNLIVQDGLKEIDVAVIKIRECVKYIKGSEGRRIKFKQCVEQTSLESQKGLQQDVPTRWNSTYTMLSSAIYYRRALCYFHLCDSNVQIPNQDEWDRVEKICQFLKVFYDATNSFSGSLYPTSNLYFPHVFLIQLHLVEKCRSPDGYMKKIAQQMFLKFNKYWSDFNLLLAIAVVFDPRYKYKVLDLSYKKLYGPESLQLATVKSTLFTLFEEYVQTPTTTDFSSSSRGSNEVHSMQDSEKDSIESKFFEVCFYSSLSIILFFLAWIILYYLYLIC